MSFCLELHFEVSLVDLRQPKVVIFNFFFKVTGGYVSVVEHLVVTLLLFVINSSWSINVFVAGFTFEILIWVSLHFWAGLIVIIIARIWSVMFEAVVPIYVVSPKRIIVIEVSTVLVNGVYRFLAVVLHRMIRVVRVI